MKCKSIMIIEDDQEIRDMLKLAIEMEGHSVITASNGKEGLEILESIELPCLILLDFMMPIMNGWEFAEAANKDIVLATIPIVMVTAYSEKAGQIKGTKGILKKPVDIDALLKIVVQYCGN
ncbi:MAG: response regulator [Bacteriovoracaceae bacterium]